MTLDREVEQRKALVRQWDSTVRMFEKSSGKLAPPLEDSVSESAQSGSKSTSANYNASSVSSSGVLVESVAESSSPELELRVKGKNVLPKNDVLYVLDKCSESAECLVKNGNVEGAVRAYVDGFEKVRSSVSEGVFLSDKDVGLLDECAVRFERCLSASKYAVGFASWYRGLVDFETGVILLNYDCAVSFDSNKVRKSLPCFAKGYAQVRRALRKGLVLCEDEVGVLEKYVSDFALAWEVLKKPEYAMKVYRRFGLLLLENGCFDGAERVFLSSLKIAEDVVDATGNRVLSCDKEKKYVGKILAYRVMRNPALIDPDLLFESCTAEVEFSMVPLYCIADTVDEYLLEKGATDE